jgi:membrane-associated phospholipid phosphatase
MKTGLLVCALLSAALCVRAQSVVDDASNKGHVAFPVSTIFYHIGPNFLHTFTHNYGLNFIVAGLETWGFVESGLDWHYNRFAYNNPDVARLGFPGLYVGWLSPAVLPLAVYWAGRKSENTRLQVTGLALTQSLIISLGVFCTLKAITGRVSPGIADVLDHKRSEDFEEYSADFAWGFARRGIFSGWPSGHTTNAFAAAATIAQIYHDNLAVKIVAYSFAVVMGLSVSVSVHWASEVIAGALIGQAIGMTVGRSFDQLLDSAHGTSQARPLSFYFTANALGVILRL